MTFYPKGLLVAAGFGAVLLLAVSARQGDVDPRFALAGLAAILLIEGLVVFGPAFRGRAR